MRNRGQLFALGRIAGSFALPEGYEFQTHMLVNLSENLWPNSNNQFNSAVALIKTLATEFNESEAADAPVKGPFQQN